MEQDPARYIGPGQQYRLIRLLGKGGAGTVYEAEHVALQRHVAIKLLDAALTREGGFVLRFQQEARAIAQLDHPNILPVFDFGEDTGSFYLVMRLVRGGSLGARLRATREATRAPVNWLPDEALFLARQILPALDVAHAQGIVHRDVKPDNILVEQDPGPGESYRAFLADFGIAKLVQTEVTLTQTGAMIGTPTYMAPEQVMGQPIDGRTDLYAFGVVLFEVLTGRVPYSGATPMSVAIQHVHTPLPDPRTLAPRISSALDAVLIQALSKEPNARYPTGADFLAALEKAVHAPASRDHEMDTVTVARGAVLPTPADQTAGPAAVRRSSSPRWLVPLLGSAAIAVLVMALAFFGIRALSATPATPTPRPTEAGTPVAAGVTGKIKIVSSFPRTGSNKPATDSIVDAIKLALSEVDNTLGAATLEYTDLDDSTAARDGWDPEREAANANQAASDPDVMVYLGTLDSAASAISIPILCQANLVMISPANTNPGLSKKIPGVQANEPDVHYPNGCKHNFARVLPTSDVQGAVAAGWAKQLGASRAYVVTNPGEGFGLYVSQSYIDYAPKIGLDVVGGPEPLTDPVALAAKIKAANPDVVFFAGSTNDNVVRLWQELRRSLPSAVRLMGPSTFAVDASFLAKAGGAAEGTYITFPTLEPRFLTGKGADFYARMRQRLGTDPEDYAAYAYDATRAALDAIRRVGRKDRAAIRDAVFASQNFDGVLGKWSFTESGDTTLLAMGGRQVRNGRIDDGSAVAVRAQ